MSKLQNNKKQTVVGAFLQMPMLFVLFIGVCITIVSIAYSFCDIVITSNGVQASFVGIEHYYELLFVDPYVVSSLIETIGTMIFAFCLCMVVMVSALFISKLNSVYGMITIAILSLCSIGAWIACLSGLENQINTTLLSLGLLSEPIMRWGFGNTIMDIFSTLPLVAPIFLITYFFAKCGKKTAGILVSVCAFPVLLVGTFCYNGLPYFEHMLGVGLSGQYDKAIAMWVIVMVLYVLWCVILCPVLFGISRLVKLIKLPQKTIKVIGYIIFTFASISAAVVLLLWFASVVFNSSMPMNDKLMEESTLYKELPLLANILYLFNMFISYDVSIYQMIFNIAVIFVISLIIILPTAIGLALIKNKYIKAIFIIWLIPLAAYIPFRHVFFIETTINIGAFFSGIGFLIVFLSIYALTKFIINSKKYIILKSILSGLCAVSIAFSVATVITWFNEYITFTGYVDEFMAAKYGVYNGVMLGHTFDFFGFKFAYDLLIFAMVIALAIVPAALFIAVYILSKKKPKEIEKVKSED